MHDTGNTAHLEDGTLLASLDGALNETERAEVEAHVAACAACAARRDRLRFAARAAAAALEALDEAPPWSGMPETLRAAGRAAPVPIDRSRTAGGASRSARRAVAAAAGLIFVLAAGAYAIPGSPVRGWVDDSIEAIATLVGARETPVAPEGLSRVSVESLAGSVRVSLLQPPPGLSLTVSLSEGGSAEASAPGASFSVGAGWIEVRDWGGAPLRVALPADADAAIDVDGTVVVRVVEGALVRTAAADRGPLTIVFDPGG